MQKQRVTAWLAGEEGPGTEHSMRAIDVILAAQRGQPTEHPITPFDVILAGDKGPFPMALSIYFKLLRVLLKFGQIIIF